MKRGFGILNSQKIDRTARKICLTVSAVMFPPLCLRGGLGRTRVTWCRGKPCVGSSDKPSQDAERDSGDEYDGREGGGEELESSHKPDMKNIIEDVSSRRRDGVVRGRDGGNWPIIFASRRHIQNNWERSYNDSNMYETRLQQSLMDFWEREMWEGCRSNRNCINAALSKIGCGQSETGKGRIRGCRAVLTQSCGDGSYSSCSRAALLNSYCVLGGKNYVMERLSVEISNSTNKTTLLLIIKLV